MKKFNFNYNLEFNPSFKNLKKIIFIGKFLKIKMKNLKKSSKINNELNNLK